jgi:LAO/AO transport system kinase
VDGVRAGDRKALARAITLVESRDELAEDLLRELFPHTGRARLIGITGSPGAGKSSLIGALIRHVRGLDLTVGVVSVDPSSPFTSGALLGDRIRLADHFLDPDVFIRSMGTRGHLGGLAEATLQAALLLDAAGKDVVFLETVGTGQSEVEVIGIADTVLLVLMPGSGDAVQALKAGIMEIPDVVAVNKMDHPAAKATLSDVRSVIALDPLVSRRPQVLLTEALRGEGVEELWEALERRRGELAADGRLDERRRRNLAGEVVAVATSRLRGRLERMVAGDAEAQALIEAVQRRDLDPLTAVDRLLDAVATPSAATAGGGSEPPAATPRQRPGPPPPR